MASSIVSGYSSTIMTKVLVAITGLGMVGFVIAHLAGNLLIFAGPEAINNYAQGLKDIGALLWVARFGLIAMILGHIYLSLTLNAKNTSARPEKYTTKKSIRSTLSSRTMAITGLTILAYIVFHLLHFTFGKIQPDVYHGTWILADGRTVHDVYSMVIAGFRNPILSAVYLVAMTLLLLHLRHAIASTIQTLGFNHPQYFDKVQKGSQALTLLLWLGYIAIPIAVLTGVIQPLQ